MRLLLLLAFAPALTCAAVAQTVDWESLDGPWGGYIALVGTAEGSAYRALDGDIERSDDGGLSWAATGFPGSGLRVFDMGHDGALLAAAASGAYRLHDDVWAPIGPEGAGARRVGAAADGAVYIWQTGCTFVRSTDLEAWQHFTPGPEAKCIDMLVTAAGEVLVIRRISDIQLSFWVDHSTDGGETWTSRSPGEHVQRLVSGQHGGTFAVAPPSADGWTGFRPPRAYRWTGSQWVVISTEHVTAVTTGPDDHVVLGFRHGFDDEALAGPLSRPKDLVRASDGSWMASTEWAGMWRWTADDGWHQIAGDGAGVSVLARDLQGRLMAGFPGSTVFFDGERWRHGLWTRSLVRAIAALPERTLLASSGYSGEGIESSLDPGVGLWDIEADETVHISPHCDEFEPCLANALILAEDVVITGLGGPVMLCRPGDARCAAGGGAGLFRSSDGGDTWTPSLEGYVNLCYLTAAGGGVIWAGAGAPGHANCPVGMPGMPEAQRVFRSGDLGQSWTGVGEALPEPYVTGLAADAHGAVVSTGSDGLFMISADGSVEGIGGPGQSVRSVGISIDGAPLAGTDDGLFAFDGVNWRSLGLSGRRIDVVRVEVDGVVMVATADGVFRTVEPLIVSTESSAPPADVALESIYPNPTSGAVMVAVTLEAPGDATLTLYDLLGRRVAVLADGVYSAGSHETRFSTAGLAAGVYVVELTAAGRRQARRLTIIDPF